MGKSKNGWALMSKERIDVLLVQRGLANSREQAKRLVMAGLVFTETERIDKAGMKIDAKTQLVVKGTLHPYVSRGGLKLEKALRSFAVTVENKVVVDVGASTGGFTDCALQHGAALVYAVDVGYGQLAWSLRMDERVRVMERVNFRYIEASHFQPRPTVGVMDVSFISIGKLFPKLHEILEDHADLITLVKPQFEAGPKYVSKGGIVRDSNVHEMVLRRVIEQAAGCGFTARALDFSPIRGGDGNIEFLLWLKKGSFSVDPLPISEIVEVAHEVDFS